MPFKLVLVLLAASLMSHCGPRGGGGSEVAELVGSGRATVLTDAYPYSTVGQLLNGLDESCTATLAWRNLVVTSAHCVFQADGSVSARLIFIPNFVDDTLRLRAGLPVRGITSPRVAARVLDVGDYKPGSGTVGQDWAILRLESPVGDTYNWMEVGSPTQEQALVNLAGYSLDIFGQQGTASVALGCKMQAVAGAHAWRHACDTVGGASGGPVFEMRAGANDEPAVLLAVHSGSESGANYATPASAFTSRLKLAVREQIAAIGDRAPGFRRYSRPDVWQPTAVKNVSSLSMGASHACYLVNGRVKCIGGTDGGVSCPACTPPAMQDVRELASGRDYACAIDGETVRCWGQNTPMNRAPKLIDDLSHPRQLTVGEWHGCVRHDKGIRCWGGTSTFDPEDGKPTDLAEIGKIARISAGYKQTCAFTSSEKWTCWGETARNNAGCSDNLWGSVKAYSGPWSDMRASGYGICVRKADGGARCFRQKEGNTCPSTLAFASTSRFKDLGTNLVPQEDEHWQQACGIDDRGVVCTGHDDAGKDRTYRPDLRGAREVGVARNMRCAIHAEGLSCWTDDRIKLIEAL